MNERRTNMRSDTQDTRMKMQPEQEPEPVPPCRVLMRSGVPVDEVITERQYRGDSFRRIDVTQIYDTPYTPNAETIHVKRGRPRTGPIKVKSEKKEHRMVTPDQVRTFLREGLNAQQIADRVGCKRGTVYSVMIREHQRHPEQLLADAELRTCPKCGESKWPSAEQCSWCKSGRSRPATRKRLMGNKHDKKQKN